MSLQPTVFDGFLVTVRATVFFAMQFFLLSAEMTVFVRVSAAFPRHKGAGVYFADLLYTACQSLALGMLYEESNGLL